VQIKDTNVFRNHRIYFPKESLASGQNTVVIRFVSNYVRDCQGIHYFVDKDDNEEYLYSQHEAADAHKAFPCFDQPDMKAPYKLLALVPKGWEAISTTYTE
jgi:aminopeptidase N